MSPYTSLIHTWLVVFAGSTAGSAIGYPESAVLTVSTTLTAIAIAQATPRATPRTTITWKSEQEYNVGCATSTYESTVASTVYIQSTDLWLSIATTVASRDATLLVCCYSNANYSQHIAPPHSKFTSLFLICMLSFTLANGNVFKFLELLSVTHKTPLEVHQPALNQGHVEDQIHFERLQV